jgi:hypothetical protein
MRPSQPLVVVVHDDPHVCVGQANTLTHAGYRCLIAGDAATALWFAVRYALDPTSPYSEVVVLSPVALPTRDLPDSVVCLPTPPPDEDLVAALERLRFRQRRHGQDGRDGRTDSMTTRGGASGWASCS